MRNALRRRFIQSVNSILEELDFEELERSCNGSDPSYAQEILQRMHQAFLNIYRTDCLTDPGLSLVELPAVIRGKRTGEVTLGLVTLDLAASGGRWNTVFITPVGVLSQNKEKMSRIQRTFLLEKFMPYDYWYTPEVPCDVHINYDNVPYKVVRLATACTGMMPEKPAMQTIA